jgi:hypothetical protein
MTVPSMPLPSAQPPRQRMAPVPPLQVPPRSLARSLARPRAEAPPAVPVLVAAQPASYHPKIPRTAPAAH